MKMHPKRKLMRTVVSIIDIICFSELIIVTLWAISLISLAVAIWQQLTK
jgi:hypothetical protein